MLVRSAPPSVLLVVEPPGSAWPHVDTLARDLSDLGVEVVVAAVTPPCPGQRVEYAGMSGVELMVCPTPIRTMAEHLASRAAIASWLLAVEEMFNPDVVHLTGYMHAGLPWRGKVLVALHSGGAAQYASLDGHGRRLCRAAFQHGVLGADLVVTQTEAMMATLKRTLGTLEGRTIRDARDARRYLPTTKESVILSVGKVRRNPKQMSALELAAPRLAWPVVVAGEQLDGDGNPVRLAGVSGLGRLHASRLAPWFGRATIYAGSNPDGSGSFAPEAALAGCALVLSDSQVLRELWGGVAVFVPPEDADAIVSAINKLLADRRLRQGLGMAARRRALAHSSKAMAEAYLACYRRLIDARAPNQFAEQGQISA